MINLLNGYVNINSKKYPILWTGERAQHIAENYMSNKNTLLHLDLQKALQKAETFKTEPKNNYIAYSVIDNVIIIIPIQIINKMASIKTGGIMKKDLDQLKKTDKRISGKPQKRKYVITTPLEEIQQVLNDGNCTSTAQEVKEFAEKMLNSKKTKK